jgi:hypothetical protein
MSHFTVAVFTEPNGKTVEELLEPYNENTSLPKYVEYTKEQLIEKGRKEITDYATTGHYAEWKANPTEYENNCRNEVHITYLKNEFPKKLNWTDEEIYADQIKYYDEDQIGSNGEVYSTYNPLSKWDWYQTGGRYSGLLRLKNGCFGSRGKKSWTNVEEEIPDNRVDGAKVRDIEFSSDDEEYNKAKIKWELYVEGRTPDNELEEAISKSQFYKSSYYTDRYKDKETYATICSQFITYAVITPDGKWHEKGETGWFGCSSETGDESLDWDLNYKKRFIDTANPEWSLTVVDCHI